MSNEYEIEQVELTIKQAKEAVDLKDSVLKLQKNKDFKAVINEGYFENQASRLVLLKADPSMQSDRDQKEIDNNIIAIGYLRQYLSSLVQLGYKAEREVLDAEEAKQELIAES